MLRILPTVEPGVEHYKPRFCVSTIPKLVTRSSPDAHLTAPTAAMDTLYQMQGSCETDAADAPGAAPSLWNVPVLRAWAVGFPFPDVHDIALLAISDGVGPFYGVLTNL